MPGSLTGVIGLIFLLLPECLIPVFARFESEIPIIAVYLVSIPLSIIFVVLTKLLLKHSIMFGALFISLGLLKFFVDLVLWKLSLYLVIFSVPSIVTILVGVSLII